jgi:prophage regulatory protein
MTMSHVVAERAAEPVGEAASKKAAPARLIRLPEVIARVGLKRSSIYQRMSDGRFPRGRSLGQKCTVWVEAEIDAWIAAVTASGDEQDEPLDQQR